MSKEEDECDGETCPCSGGPVDCLKCGAENYDLCQMICWECEGNENLIY